MYNIIHHTLPLTALLLAPLAAQAQTNSPLSPTTDRDDLCLFTVPPNADAGYFENAGYRGGSHMTPVEGAHCTPSIQAGPRH